MSATPKWYCRNKSQPTQTFIELSKLGQQLRHITKRLTIDVKVDIFSEHDNILEECERVVELYWSLKDQSRNKEFQTLSKKIKRSPYNALLMRKFNCLMDLNERHFCQLHFVLKKTLNELLRKAMQSELWLIWALRMAQLYNKCRQPNSNGKCNPSIALDTLSVDKETLMGGGGGSDMNASICSNLYPALLLPHKPAIDFAHVLQLYAQTRIEQTSLDLLFGLFNMPDQQHEHELEQEQQPPQSPVETAAAPQDDDAESTCSSLEILRILTLNIACDGEFQQYYDNQRDLSMLQCTSHTDDAVSSINASLNVQQTRKSVRRQHTEQFLQRERAFIAQLIAKAAEISPTIFGANTEEVDLNVHIMRGMRLIWSYVAVVLDHIILWWIDTPISCYSLSHVDAIRHWLYTQTPKDIPEPVYSTLRGIGEILTNNFVCNNAWDQLFRLTLVAADKTTVEHFVSHYKGAPHNVGLEFGTPTGIAWVTVFWNLFDLSNNYFLNDEQNSSLLPVAEQIPILHRIDHSVHSMRLWVTEKAKHLCADWKIDTFFQILEHDVRICLQLFTTLKLPKLTADLSDILMLVCVALRTKLICEVNANIDKLKKTTDECVHIMSAICRLLSLANFTLCFPPASYWQKNSFSDDDCKSGYVEFVLEQLFMPTIKATKDIVILKLVLKIICEAWLDFIYRRRIRFSVNGAVRLLNDFDAAAEWILNCQQLDENTMEKLSNHEVLRMCKGVGKILLRKPEDVISITQSPKYDKRQSDSTVAQETQLPSEMFVSNQKHWLELRARGSQFPCLKLCCGDI